MVEKRVPVVCESGTRTSGSILFIAGMGIHRGGAASTRASTRISTTAKTITKLQHINGDVINNTKVTKDTSAKPPVPPPTKGNSNGGLDLKFQPPRSSSCHFNSQRRSCQHQLTVPSSSHSEFNSSVTAHMLVQSSDPDLIRSKSISNVQQVCYLVDEHLKIHFARKLSADTFLG